jgi:hypothetical protein
MEPAMGDDPRWNEAAEFLEWSKTNDTNDHAEEFIQRFQRYGHTLEAIAADPLAAEADRVAAQELLDDLRAHAKAHTAEAIAKLVELANDEDIDPNVRLEARQSLRSVAEPLRAQGMDIIHLIAHPDGKPN